MGGHAFSKYAFKFGTSSGPTADNEVSPDGLASFASEAIAFNTQKFKCGEMQTNALTMTGQAGTGQKGTKVHSQANFMILVKINFGNASYQQKKVRLIQLFTLKWERSANLGENLASVSIAWLNWWKFPIGSCYNSFCSGSTAISRFSFEMRFHVKGCRLAVCEENEQAVEIINFVVKVINCPCIRGELNVWGSFQDEALTK